MNRSNDLETVVLCPALVVQNAILGTCCLLGILSNSILIRFTFRHRRGEIMPDKLLIANFAIVDLVACIIGLPLHITAINGLSENAVCLARFLTTFTSFAVNIMTLAAISIDRYDALCQAPLRKITLRKASYGVLFIWLFASSTTVIGGVGHILTSVHGERVCLAPGREIPAYVKVGKLAMLFVVSLWILPSIFVIFRSFFGIVKHVRNHSASLHSILGASGVKREVTLTKICIVIIVTYLGLWVPFAVMVMLRNARSSLIVHCSYLWAYSFAFCSFTVVPIEYMILDKRFLSYVIRQLFRRGKVSAKDPPRRQLVMKELETKTARTTKIDSQQQSDSL